MKSSKTSFLRNCISGWNVRLTLKLLVICISRGDLVTLRCNSNHKVITAYRIDSYLL